MSTVLSSKSARLQLMLKSSSDIFVHLTQLSLSGVYSSGF